MMFIMKDGKLYSRFSIVAFFVYIGVSSEAVVLEPTSVNAIENTSVVLTCTIDNFTFSRWNVRTLWASIYQSNELCMADGFILENSSLYTWFCHNNGSFSLTLKNLKRSQHGDTWVCGTGFVTSKEVVINITFPVEKAEITTPSNSSITLIENQMKLFTCNTSYSRPKPTVKWYMRSEGNTSQMNITSSVEIVSVDEKGFQAASSQIHISVNREKQGAFIYCTGYNGFGAEVASQNILLNIHYAPERGPYIDKAPISGIYILKERNLCNLTCKIPWGNPIPELAWNCSGTLHNSSAGKQEVTLNLQWLAERDKDKVCTCTSKQKVAGEQTAVIRIVIFYPPTIESIKFYHIDLKQPVKINRTVHIIENERYKLICEARSKPESWYTWTGLKSSNASTIVIASSTRQNYTETCRATNTMNFTDTWSETGNISRSIDVQILYPPSINDMPAKRVIEGSSVELTCPIKHGVPPVTNAKWTRKLGDKAWIDYSFTIYNVSRNDSMTYTCTVNNTMVMTGNIRKIGSESKNTQLTVLYPPNKPTLVLVSVSDSESVNHTLVDRLIVVEHTPFTLTCAASSLPMPNFYSWNQMSNTSVLKSPGLKRNNKADITCHVRNTMVTTEGTFVTGNNNITLYIDILFSPDIGNMASIRSEEGQNVTFSCPVVQGNPTQTSVVWTRKTDEQQWIGEHFTIVNVTRNDSTTYTCMVNNTMIMTGGFIKEGNNNKSIELNVLYKVAILKYLAINYTESDTVTVAENNTVNLKCEIEGNPEPVGTIFSQEQLVVTKSISENYKVLSVTFEASCFHKGIYTCRGTNAIEHEHVSERNISLYVTCSPREDPSTPLQRRIKISKNKDMSLNFTVLAYPEPTNILINKHNGLTWMPLNDSDNYNITNTGLNIQFSIQRVSNEDYGKYKLIISNDYGKFEHVFYVEATAKELSGHEPSNTPVNYGLVVGLPLVTLIIAIILVVIVIFYRKRNNGVPDKLVYQNVPFTGNKLKIKRKYQSSQSKEGTGEELQEIDDVPHYLTEPTEYFNSPDKIEQIERIKVSELFSYVSEKSNESFGIDYQKLPSGLQKPCTFARKPENLPLNRYNGIYPYDHSRVKIPSYPEFFINACYIDGYKRTRAYIASLGPTTKTTNDFHTFWQMVWYEETDIVVMLTNLNEPSGMKCERYWPPDESDMDYGAISVKSIAVKVFAEYTFRSFHIIKNGQKRNLTHLHFTAWPDKTVPEDTTCLLEFRRRIKSVPTSSKGPIIVHCSAGIGRTGTLIAIDRLIEEGETIGSVNVFGCVEAMRDQRVKMVQTLEQYVYIYKALVNALVFGCETIPIGRFENYITQNNDDFYNKHYKQLRQSVEKEKKDDSDARAKNKRLVKYNRQGGDVPGLRFRVMLCLTRQCGDHDYINAVYMNTHVKKDHVIIAQTPLPDTVEDFICMIYNENCTCVVTMEDLQEPGTMIGQYVSENKHPKSYGHFSVVCSRLETKDEYIVRQMKIKYNGITDSSEKVAYHFQYTKWMPGQDTPVSAIEFLHFIEKVENYDSEFSDNYSHILVHCLKANERSGLFCAVKILREKISEENEINVGNVLRHLRTRRRTAVTSMEQVKFCYQAAGAYIKMRKPLLRQHDV